MKKTFKAIAKKALVYAVAMSMMVTPLSASASGLKDVYDIEADGGKSTGTGTGTATKTSTKTNTSTKPLEEVDDTKVLDDFDANIIGIVVDKESVSLVKDEADTDTLTASFLFDGDRYPNDEEMAALNKLVKWDVTYANGDSSLEGKNVVATKSEKESRNVATLTAKHGGDTYVVAKIGNYVSDVVKVHVKEYTTAMAFNPMNVDKDGKNNAYFKHVIDMNEYLVRTPGTANDDIAWDLDVTSTGKGNLAAGTKLSENGILTIGKQAGTIEIVAVAEKDVEAKIAIVISEGNPVTKIAVKEVTLSVAETDMNKVQKNNKGVPTKVFTDLYEDGVTATITIAVETKNGGDTTDVVAWTTSKAAIANFSATSKTFASNESDATVVPATVGTATIKAKATSGKTVALPVAVAASLRELSIDAAKSSLYSGQSMQMTAVKTPTVNKNAVKWSIAKVTNDKNKQIANPNATINGQGVLTVKDIIDDTYSTVTVVATCPNAVKVGNKKVAMTAEYEVNVEQASIDTLEITDWFGKTAKADATTTKAKDLKATVKIDTAKDLMNVPKTKKAYAKAGTDTQDFTDTLAWKSVNTKIATVDDNGNITAVKAGKVNVTVTGINISTNNKGKKVAKKLVVTVPVVIKQPVKSLTLAKNLIVVNKNVGQAAVSVKKVNPTNGFIGNLKWTVNGTAQDVKTNGKKAFTYKFSGLELGKENVVTVTDTTGAKASAVVKYMTPIKGVEIYNGEAKVNGKKVEMSRGASDVKLAIKVKVGTGKDAKSVAPASETGIEKASFTVDKAGYVRIAADGTVKALRKGTVKVTAITESGKKSVVTIKIK